MSSNNLKNKYNGGVTLLELLIVMIIISIITATSIVGYRDSRSSIATQNLADDIALSIRKAQSYAIGVQGIKTSFEQGYGVHFSVNPDTSNLSLGSSKSFIIFADINKNGKYDKDSSSTCGSPVGVPTTTNECIEILSITTANKISSVTGVGDLDIIFRRPNPEPNFCYLGSCVSNVSSVQIQINRDDGTGTPKIIIISNTGQISVI